MFVAGNVCLKFPEFCYQMSSELTLSSGTTAYRSVGETQDLPANRTFIYSRTSELSTKQIAKQEEL